MIGERTSAGDAEERQRVRPGDAREALIGRVEAFMDAEVYPNGHSALGVSFSTHSLYALPDGYEAALIVENGVVNLFVAKPGLHRTPPSNRFRIRR